ncbi:hypothetical protein [Phocaeicola plebeius]|uniref:hypothetical protein n=1 Tax=Phocaeicola plebeius TaxID=310297 RepID=UPI002011031A|nr:hypothetical protein [Phocaeicola plebeius]MCL1614542.1 hypothetical protein [Phocaeicola plebeius]
MAKELSVLQQQAETIKTEVNKGANTSSRIGGMFGDMLEYNEERLTELANKTAGVNYVICETAAGTAAKTVSITGLTSLTTGIRLLVKMANINTASNATLNINSLGAKPLYYDNERASSDNSWEAGEVIDVYYDGTNFYAGNVQGGSSEGSNKILTWNTDADTTRKQVPSKERKAGMQISYLHPDNGWVNEQYIGTETIDTEWGKNDNWSVFSMIEYGIGDKFINGDLTHFISGKYIGTNGQIYSGGSNEYVTDFLKVKKGERIIVITKIKKTANALSFYKKQDENSYIEGLNGFDTEHIPNISSKTQQSFVKIEYTPKQDGYIRVCFQEFNLEFQDYLTYNPPAIISGKDYDEMLKDAELNTDIELSPISEKYYRGYITKNNNKMTIVRSSNENDRIYFVFVPKGCKIKAITAQINCFIAFKEFIDSLFLHPMTFERNQVQLELLAEENLYIGIGYRPNMGDVFDGKKLPYVSIQGKLKRLDESINSKEDILLKDIDGVQDHSLENLFDPKTTLSYDSSFADNVYSAIGRKTDETGCYSAPIPCKEGDYFTRTGLGTGIVVVMDSSGNILGDVKNAAYSSTIQIKASDGQDFSAAASVSFVVMIEEKNDVKIVKAKYVPSGTGDFITIPNLQIKQENMSPDIITYVMGASGKRYELYIDDSGDSPLLKVVALEGIPSSQLPSDFPELKVTGDFSKYYDYIILSMRNAGTPYLVQINSRGEVVRYLQKDITCFKTIVENGKRYYYGSTGSPNASSGELLIYEENGETFRQVGESAKFTTGEVIEPHDTLVISVSEKHYILQRYVPNSVTTVDGEQKTVTSLHVEEQYNGKRVWLWKSEDYPELWEDSHNNGNNSDYLHNNTIWLDKDGNLCLNNKYANQILVIERTWDDETHTGSIGNIIWKIGGDSNKPDYDIPTRIKTTSTQQWFESHSAIVNSNGLWNMFDNRGSAPSRILEFEVDYDAKTLKEGTFKAYTMKSYFGRYQGSADKLGEGIYLVSWGSTKSSGTPMLGVYDFKNNKTIFEMDSDNIGRSVYRVYGFKK